MPWHTREKVAKIHVLLRESETTIKIKFAFSAGGGGGAGGQRGKLSKTLFFVGNATTIKTFESEKFIVEKFCCHGAGS